MTRSEAVRILRVPVPCTENMLKTAYKRMSLLEHPDRSQHPDAPSRFQSISEAYAFLKRFAEAETIEVVEADAKTQSGERLDGLGKGLGPTTSAAACENCTGRGYHSSSIAYKACVCRLCKGCGGSGLGVFVFRFHDRHQKAKVVYGDCVLCSGRGEIPRTMRRASYIPGGTCQLCFDSGSVPNPNGPKTHYLCSTCKGSGEVALWNPVIPRGLLI